MTGLVTFVDVGGHGTSSMAADIPAGPGPVINVTWLGSSRIPNVPGLREFADSANGRQEAHELYLATRAITVDWFSGRPTPWSGLHAGQLVEDPLGIMLMELAFYAAAVRTCLEDLHVVRLTLAGSRRSTWLVWAAAIAEAMGIQTEWRRRASPKDVTAKLRGGVWPLLSPVAHAAARSMRHRGEARDPSRSRYLFVAEFPREDHLNALHRVARELDGEQDWVIPWNPATGPAVKAWLDGHGRTAVDLRDYYDWSIAASELVDRFDLARQAGDETERLLRVHLPGKRYAWGAFRLALNDAAWRMAPRASGLVRAAQNLVRDRQPRAALLMSDYNYLSRIVTLGARAEDVPTVQLQHGIWAAPDDNPMWGIPVLTTKVALWNEFSGRWYTGHGVLDEQLVVTGNPRYDCFSESIPESERLAESETPMLLVITDAGPVSETAALLSATRNAVSRLPFRVRVIVKIHPYESVQDIAPLVGNWGDHAVSVQREGDSTALVRQASLVVAITSTVVFEALLAACPVVLVSYAGVNRFAFHEDTPFLVADNETHAGELISAVLTDRSFAALCQSRCTQYTREHWAFCGRGAARRVAGLLVGLGEAGIFGSRGRESPAVAS